MWSISQRFFKLLLKASFDRSSVSLFLLLSIHCYGMFLFTNQYLVSLFKKRGIVIQSTLFLREYLITPVQSLGECYSLSASVKSMLVIFFFCCLLKTGENVLEVVLFPEKIDFITNKGLSSFFFIQEIDFISNWGRSFLC